MRTAGNRRGDQVRIDHRTIVGVDLIEDAAGAVHEEQPLAGRIECQGGLAHTRLARRQIEAVQLHTRHHVELDNLVAAVGGQREHAVGIRLGDLDVIRVRHVAGRRQREIQQHRIGIRLAAALVETIVDRDV